MLDVKCASENCIPQFLCYQHEIHVTNDHGPWTQHQGLCSTICSHTIHSSWKSKGMPKMCPHFVVSGKVPRQQTLTQHALIRSIPTASTILPSTAGQRSVRTSCYYTSGTSPTELLSMQNFNFCSYKPNHKIMKGVQGSQWYLGTLYWLLSEPRHSSKELVKAAKTIEWFLETIGLTSEDVKGKWLQGCQWYLRTLYWLVWTSSFFQWTRKSSENIRVIFGNPRTDLWRC